MDLSFQEIMIIMVAIVVLFGPDKLPKIARDLGSGVRKMKGAVEDIKTEILKETDNPVSEIKKEIQKVKDAAADYHPESYLKKEIEGDESAAEAPKTTKEDQLKDDYQGPVSR